MSQSPSFYSEAANDRIPGFHSEKEYVFPDSQASDIVRVCSFHTRDYELSVIWFSTREHDGIGNLCTPASRAPVTDLGNLKRLPLELLDKVLLQMDMASLFHFRHTNLQARHVVASTRQYRTVTSHGLNVFCALMRTQSATRVKLHDFYRVLCEDKCTFCSSFGDLVHLPSWVRCCSSCLARPHQELRMISLAAAERIPGLANETLAALSKLKSVPGHYTRDELQIRKRTWLVPINSAIAASQDPGEGPGRILSSSMLARQSAKRSVDFMACCAIPSYDPRTNTAFAGLSCAGCQLVIESGDIVPRENVPFVMSYRARVHSRESFLSHFSWCKTAQALWMSSKEGTVLPANYPEIARDGGYIRSRE